jgi:hypothetical protein
LFWVGRDFCTVTSRPRHPNHHGRDVSRSCGRSWSPPRGEHERVYEDSVRCAAEPSCRPRAHTIRGGPNSAGAVGEGPRIARRASRPFSILILARIGDALSRFRNESARQPRSDTRRSKTKGRAEARPPVGREAATAARYSSLMKGYL